MTRKKIATIINIADPSWDGPYEWHNKAANQIIIALWGELAVIVCFIVLAYLAWEAMK